MKREFVFMDISEYQKNGINDKLFKQLITNFYVCKNRFYYYLENSILKEIEIDTDKILIIGNYE